MWVQILICIGGEIQFTNSLHYAQLMSISLHLYDDDYYDEYSLKGFDCWQFVAALNPMCIGHKLNIQPIQFFLFVVSLPMNCVRLCACVSVFVYVLRFFPLLFGPRERNNKQNKIRFALCCGVYTTVRAYNFSFSLCVRRPFIYYAHDVCMYDE